MARLINSVVTRKGWCKLRLGPTFFFSEKTNYLVHTILNPKIDLKRISIWPIVLILETFGFGKKECRFMVADQLMLGRVPSISSSPYSPDSFFSSSFFLFHSFELDAAATFQPNSTQVWLPFYTPASCRSPFSFRLTVQLSTLNFLLFIIVFTLSSSSSSSLSLSAFRSSFLLLFLVFCSFVVLAFISWLFQSDILSFSATFLHVKVACLI